MFEYDNFSSHLSTTKHHELELVLESALTTFHIILNRYELQTASSKLVVSKQKSPVIEVLRIL